MRRSDPDQRREHIIAVAEALLQRDGYRRTTIAGIAREAGISVGSVYLEFESKDAIVAELSRRCHQEILSRMETAFGGHEDLVDGLRAALQARVLAQHAHARSHPHAVELFQCDACDGVAQAVRDFSPVERRFVSELLDLGQDRGVFHLTDRSDVVAGTMLRLLDRLGPAQERILAGRSLEREVLRACELLVGGLRGS